MLSRLACNIGKDLSVMANEDQQLKRLSSGPVFARITLE